MSWCSLHVRRGGEGGGGGGGLARDMCPWGKATFGRHAAPKVMMNASHSATETKGAWRNPYDEPHALCVSPSAYSFW